MTIKLFRDFKNFNMDVSEKDLGAIDWSLATENIETDLGFKTFVQLFHRVLDRYNKIYKS